MNIILCGMPGSGKSYYGALAAKSLKRAFIDTDDLVTSKYSTHATCREIALNEGELFFRQLESEVLIGLKNSPHAIIALGGGAISRSENIPILKALGWVIYLKVSPEILLQRLRQKPVLPSYLDPADIPGSFNALLKKRLPLYEQHCHHCIDVDRENVLDAITEKCHGK